MFIAGDTEVSDHQIGTGENLNTEVARGLDPMQERPLYRRGNVRNEHGWPDWESYSQMLGQFESWHGCEAPVNQHQYGRFSLHSQNHTYCPAGFAFFRVHSKG